MWRNRLSARASLRTDQMQRKTAVLMEQVLSLAVAVEVRRGVYLVYIICYYSQQAKLMAITYHTTCFACSPCVHVGFLQTVSPSSFYLPEAYMWIECVQNMSTDM